MKWKNSATPSQGAVLLPGEQAREAMNEQRFHFYLPELTLLKEYWGISIAAMFARAKNLGIINDYVYAKLNQGYQGSALPPQ